MNTNLERCPQHAWHLEQEENNQSLEIDNGNEAEEIAIRGWNESQESEMKTRVLKGLTLQIKVNNLKRQGKEIPTEYLIELLKI